MKRHKILFSLIGATTLFLLLFGIGSLWFSGVAHFLAFINGKALYLAPRTLDLGSHAAGDEAFATFKITNLTSKEISVIGIRTSCACTLPEDLPIAIAPGKTVDVEMAVSLPRFSSSYDETIVFMIAEPNRLGMHPVRIMANIPNPLPLPVVNDEESDFAPVLTDAESTDDYPTHE